LSGAALAAIDDAPRVAVCAITAFEVGVKVLG